MFGQREFGRYFVNGVVVAGSVVIVSALIAFLAATAVTRFRFRFRTTLPTMFRMARTVPVEALTIPLFFLVRDFGRRNTLGALILPRIAFSLPFAIRMPRGFVKAVPEALEVAAYLGGASRARFRLWRIFFPLVLPGPVATSVFSFVSVLHTGRPGPGRGHGRVHGDDDFRCWSSYSYSDVWSPDRAER